MALSRIGPGCNCCDFAEQPPADQCDENGGLAGRLDFSGAGVIEQNARIELVDSLDTVLVSVRSNEAKSLPLDCNTSHVWSNLIGGGTTTCDFSGATLTSNRATASKTTIPGVNSSSLNFPQFANSEKCVSDNFTWEYDLTITGVAGAPADCSKFNNSIVRVRPGLANDDSGFGVEVQEFNAFCPTNDRFCSEPGAKWPEQIIGTIAGVVGIGVNCPQFNAAFAMDVGYRALEIWYQGEIQISATEWIVLVAQLLLGTDVLLVRVEKFQEGAAGGNSFGQWQVLASSRTHTCNDPSFWDMAPADFDLDGETIPGTDWDCDFSAATVTFANVP